MNSKMGGNNSQCGRFGEEINVHRHRQSNHDSSVLQHVAQSQRRSRYPSCHAEIYFPFTKQRTILNFDACMSMHR